VALERRVAHLQRGPKQDRALLAYAKRLTASRGRRGHADGDAPARGVGRRRRAGDGAAAGISGVARRQAARVDDERWRA
jgi:hypothetical protein